MQVHHDPTKILILGKSGMGKTTYLIRYVKNSHHNLKIIFDHKLEFYARLGIEPITTKDGMLQALLKKVPILSFSHLEEFPGNAQGAFEWLCEWTYEMGRQLNTSILFCADEVNRFTGNIGDDWEFNQLIEDGRLWGLDFVGTSHAANQIHNRLRGQLTEIVALNTEERLPLQFLEERGFDVREIQSLPKGAFVLKDCVQNKFIRGKLFSVDNVRSKSEEKVTTNKKPQNEINPHGGSNRRGSGGLAGNAGNTVPEPSNHREPYPLCLGNPPNAGLFFPALGNFQNLCSSKNVKPSQQTFRGPLPSDQLLPLKSLVISFLTVSCFSFR